MVKQIELEPIPETIEDYEAIEKELKKFFFDELYKPLLEILKVNKAAIMNSISTLSQAILSSRIWFYRGQFKGKFNASISKELRRLGAKFDKKEKSYKINLSQLPPDIRQAIEASESRFGRTANRINAKLSELFDQDISEKLNITDLFDKSIYKVNKRISDQLKKITVAPQLTPAQQKTIAKDYNNNMKLYVKDFAKEEIVSLRDKIQKHVLSGGRYEDMIKQIQRSYHVSESKAKFLARQETSILMSKFKETRYKDAGSQKYKWRCVVGSAKHPVRPMHKTHNGKVFLWSSPPVINSKGERKHPGQDYGCRCTAVPIISFKELL